MLSNVAIDMPFASHVNLTLCDGFLGHCGMRLLFVMLSVLMLAMTLGTFGIDVSASDVCGELQTALSV